MTSYVETHYTRDGTVYFNGRPVWQMGQQPGTAPYRILRMLSDTPMTAAEVAETLKIPRRLAHISLVKLARRRMVERLENPLRFRGKP